MMFKMSGLDKQFETHTFKKKNLKRGFRPSLF